MGSKIQLIHTLEEMSGMSRDKFRLQVGHVVMLGARRGEHTTARVVNPTAFGSGSRGLWAVGKGQWPGCEMGRCLGNAPLCYQKGNHC